MARILFSCLLALTLCVVIKSYDAENHRHVRRTVNHYKVPSQSRTTKGSDEESKSPEVESSSSLPSSSFSSKLSPTKSFRSNGTPQRTERIARTEPDQNKISSVSSYSGGLPKSRITRDSADSDDFTSPTQPSASPSPLATYPSFQKNNSPQSTYGTSPLGTSPFGASPLGTSPFGASPLGTSPFGASPLGTSPFGASPFGASPLRASPFGASALGASPFGSLFSGQLGSPFPMRGLMANSFGNDGFGGMAGAGMVILRKCCDNFNNCRMLKGDEVCGPEIMSSPSPSSPSSSPESPATKSLSPYVSPGTLNREHDENVSSESLEREHRNANDIAPGNKNHDEKPPMPFSTSPLDLIRKQLSNGGLRNGKILSVGRCCIKGQCLDIQLDEECGDDKFMERLNNASQTDDGESKDDGMADLKKMMDGHFKRLGMMPFGSFKGSDDDDDNGMLKPGKQNNAPFSPKKQSKNGQSNVPANGIDSYDDMMKQFMQSDPVMNSENGQFKQGNGIGPYGNKQNKPRKHPYVGNEDFNKSELQKIRKEVLEKTNEYRMKHNVAPLEMDENINNYAQEWANKLKNRALEHRTEHLYGENLFRTTDPDNFGEEAVNAWYNELALYNLDDSEKQLFSRSDVQHMTQLLWIPSKKLGVGVAKDSRGYIVVANYDPPGNLGGHFIKNLPTFTKLEIEEAKEATKEANKRKFKWVRSGPIYGNQMSFMNGFPTR